jgi:hypothetical protein
MIVVDSEFELFSYSLDNFKVLRIAKGACHSQLSPPFLGVNKISSGLEVFHPFLAVFQICRPRGSII